MRQTPHVHMVYVRLLTVPPIALGVWSMALVLWQPPEYYYYLARRLIQKPTHIFKEHWWGDFSYKVLGRHGYVKRKATKKKLKMPDGFEQVKAR